MNVDAPPRDLTLQSDPGLARNGVADTRQQAASMLREARRRLAAGQDAADICGWALAQRSDSRGIQRLMIDALLQANHSDDAITLVNTALARRPADWRLWVSKARALVDLARLDDARTAIEHALSLRPSSHNALLVAADIASALGEQAVALVFVQKADQQRSRDPAYVRRLVEALLKNERAQEALAVIEQMMEAPPELVARVLSAVGRTLDARLLLESAIELELDAARQQPLTLALIDLLIAAGDWPALRTTWQRWSAAPAVAARMVGVLMTMGCFDQAAAALDCAAQSGQSDHEAAAALAAHAGQRDEALDHLARRSPSRRARVHQPVNVQPWLNVLMGATLAEQTDARGARRAGADPSPSVLGGLLQDAAKVLEQALRGRASPDQVRRWQLLLEGCAPPADVAAVGLDREFSMPALRQAA